MLASSASNEVGGRLKAGVSAMLGALVEVLANSLLTAASAAVRAVRAVVEGLVNSLFMAASARAARTSDGLTAAAGALSQGLTNALVWGGGSGFGNASDLVGDVSDLGDLGDVSDLGDLGDLGVLGVLGVLGDLGGVEAFGSHSTVTSCEEVLRADWIPGLDLVGTEVGTTSSSDDSNTCSDILNELDGVRTAACGALSKVRSSSLGDLGDSVMDLELRM